MSWRGLGNSSLHATFWRLVPVPDCSCQRSTFSVGRTSASSSFSQRARFWIWKRPRWRSRGATCSWPVSARRIRSPFSHKQSASIRSPASGLADLTAGVDEGFAETIAHRGTGIPNCENLEDSLEQWIKELDQPQSLDEPTDRALAILQAVLGLAESDLDLCSRPACHAGWSRIGVIWSSAWGSPPSACCCALTRTTPLVQLRCEPVCSVWLLTLGLQLRRARDITCLLASLAHERGMDPNAVRR